MGIRHLVIPSSFFPSIGGAQGSLLNFIGAFPQDEKVYLFMGIRGFLFSLLKNRKFQLAIPYYSKIIAIDSILIVYLLLLRFSIRPNVIWLYGGGLMAARVLERRWIFGSRVKLVLRSMGEDIQHDQYSDYGFELGSFQRKFISKAYTRADMYWSLGSEITQLYREIGVPQNKIFEIGNIVAPPPLPSRGERRGKIKIGIIGREHKKKNFDLLKEIIPLMSSEQYEFHLKIAGTPPQLEGENIFIHKPSQVRHLEYWPPDDVWVFYSNIEILLVLSRIESFGNVTFEAGLAGAVIVMNRKVTGAALATKCGLKVQPFDDFTATHIIQVLQSVDLTSPNELPRSHELNDGEIRNMIRVVSDA